MGAVLLLESGSGMAKGERWHSVRVTSMPQTVQFNDALQVALYVLSNIKHIRRVSSRLWWRAVMIPQS